MHKQMLSKMVAERDQEGMVSEALNRLAREQLKRKLLADILVDITVCRLEGWDYKSYLRELKELIESLEGGNE